MPRFPVCVAWPSCLRCRVQCGLACGCVMALAVIVLRYCLHGRGGWRWPVGVRACAHADVGYVVIVCPRCRCRACGDAGGDTEHEVGAINTLLVVRDTQCGHGYGWGRGWHTTCRHVASTRCVRVTLACRVRMCPAAGVCVGAHSAGRLLAQEVQVLLPARVSCRYDRTYGVPRPRRDS